MNRKESKGKGVNSSFLGSDASIYPQQTPVGSMAVSKTVDAPLLHSEELSDPTSMNSNSYFSSSANSRMSGVDQSSSRRVYEMASPLATLMLQMNWLVISSLMAIVRFCIIAHTLVRIGFGLFLLLLVRIACTVSERMSRTLKSFGRQRRAIKAASRRLKEADSYENWSFEASKIDQLEGLMKWKNEPATLFEFDEHVLRVLIDRLKIHQRQGDRAALAFTLSSICSRGFAGLDNPRLYSYVRLGSKHIIDEYYGVVEDALSFLCAAESRSASDEDEINNEGILSSAEISNSLLVGNKHAKKILAPFSLGDQLCFVERAKQSLGHTALCLSGGGTLALSHAGVVRELFKAGCLPKIISGTSGGAIIAALLAVTADDEMATVFVPEIVNRASPYKFLPSAHQKLWNIIHHGVIIDTHTFERCCEYYFGPFTFEEAFHRTGRIVNITVCVSKKGRPYPMLLNYQTAPQVLLASAVTASCAIPGLMDPVILMAKNRNGEIIPYFPEGVEWIDGSVMVDIPRSRLTELFNCTQFIVSQVNPHVRPFVVRGPHSDFSDSMLAFLSRMESLIHADLKHRTDRLLQLGVMPRVRGEDLSGMFTQVYTTMAKSEILICPRFALLEQFRMFSHPTTSEMSKLLKAGELAAWEKLSSIKYRTRLERLLDYHLIALRRKKAEKDWIRSFSTRSNSRLQIDTEYLTTESPMTSFSPTREYFPAGRIRRNSQPNLKLLERQVGKRNSSPGHLTFKNLPWSTTPLMTALQASKMHDEKTSKIDKE